MARLHNHTTASPVRIAIDMRTRSSRLFFVLLHLVGVSVPSRRSPSSGGRAFHPSGLYTLLRRRLSSLALSSGDGIVGVHPTAVLLSRLALESSRRGLRGLADRVERVWGWDADADLLGDPYWFQDKADGRCLSPYGGGFGECGDATLWRVRRRPLTRRQERERRYRARQRRLERRERKRGRSGSGQRRRRPGSQQPMSEKSKEVCVWPFFCERESHLLQPTRYGTDEVYGYEYEEDEEDEEGFALQFIDMDAVTANSSFSSFRKKNRRPRSILRIWGSDKLHEVEEEDAECLLSFPTNGEESALQIGSCSAEEAWVWHVNRDGILVRGLTKSEKKRRKRGRWRSLGERPSDFGCIHRSNSTSAVLLPCDHGGDGRHRETGGKSLVGFSLVRYPSTAPKGVPVMDADDDDTPFWEPWTTLEGPSVVKGTHPTPAATKIDEEIVKSPEQHLPMSHTSSGNQASAGAKHPRHVDLKSTASMLYSSLEPGHGRKAKRDAATSASHIRDAPVAINGVAFHNQLTNTQEVKNNDLYPSNGLTSTKLHKLSQSKRDGRNSARAKGQTPIHEEKRDPSKARSESHHHGHPYADSSPHRPRKIPIHPYIQSSKDFIWVDPLTSLEYPTDLCRYLGHTKKEAGRHTLMGVGQYYRTAFNIKVYGAALYVAKRDVLADPKFGEFAALTADELRGREDFYEHLMNMPPPGDDAADSIGGFFDRTLLIKINMQLSTDAMRKSLEADWSLLTDEMKKLIIDSSFEERQANDRMQRKIQSRENSSNCSCGQSAPPELKADPSCCARGTELVFTWRKNGDFEIRLDGFLMDVFPRPDVARGIFAEYMNNDPISLDAKAHFADGFPFLLAPLAQVKGMSSAVPSGHRDHETSKGKMKSHSPMSRLMDAAAQGVGAMNTQALAMSKWMTDGAASASSNALSVARELGEELDRQRMELLEGAVALQKEGMEMLSHLIMLSTEEDGLALTLVNPARQMPRVSRLSDGFDMYYEDFVGMTPPKIMPDEIGISIEPTMNFTHRLFFTAVHIYLLLLIVLSLPGNSYTVVVKRRILETKKLFLKAQSAKVRWPP